MQGLLPGVAGPDARAEARRRVAAHAADIRRAHGPNKRWPSYRLASGGVGLSHSAAPAFSLVSSFAALCADAAGASS